MDPVAVDRYVRALFNAATSLSHEQLVEQDLVSLKKELRRSGLKNFLENPRYPLRIKMRTIEKIGNMFSSTLSANFLRIILLHSRTGLLEQISDRYIELHREAKGIVTCNLLFATQPSEEFLILVEKELKRITGMNVELQIQTDPEILGGVRLKIKNHVLDGTYRKSLELMKERLLEGQYT
ncbi:ATP synthase subunit delta [Gammaproteobacteria bacterium]